MPFAVPSTWKSWSLTRTFCKFVQPWSPIGSREANIVSFAEKRHVFQTRLSLLIFLSVLAVGRCTTARELTTFDDWKSRCLAAPSNRTLRGRMPTLEQLPIKDFEIVDSQARQLLGYFQQSDLAAAENWVGQKPNDSEFFDIQRSYFTRPPLPFQPFTQKLDIDSASKVIFHGDFHGDIRSFISTLDWLNEAGYLAGFKIKSPKTLFVFLGDYVDRGSYGVEVLHTLMRLKLENPDQVLMVRGNHEDYQMTANYGFLNEGRAKYGRAFNPLAIWRTYDFLPVVLYLGVNGNYLQCNHGGMEPGYDPKQLLASTGKVRYQLLGRLEQKSFAREHPDWLKNADAATKRMANSKLMDFLPQSPVQPASIGFMWNDFFVFPDEPILGFNPSRLAFNHGQLSTQYLLRAGSLETAKLRAVFRAHQHSSVPNPMMNRLIASRGAFRHWQDNDKLAKAGMSKLKLADLVETSPRRSIPEGSVWTFNVSPDSVYGSGNDYGFDTIGILETADTFDAWRLQLINVPVSTQ